MSEVTLLSIMKYLKQNKLQDSWISLQNQSHIQLFKYPKQIEFFRKIILKGDFQECIEFFKTIQPFIENKTFKNACLSIYKQKLYELINLPNQQQLKNLFQTEILNYCSEEEFQNLFALLTCRKTQQIRGLNDWTVIKGRLKVFQQLFQVIHSLLYQNKEKNYLPSIQSDINLDEAMAVYLEVANTKITQDNSANNLKTLIKDNNSLSASRRSQVGSQLKNSIVPEMKKQIQLQLSQSNYQKSIVGAFDKKSKIYTKNLSSMQQIDSQKITTTTHRSPPKQLQHYTKNEYSPSKFYQQQHINEIEQESQKSQNNRQYQITQKSKGMFQIPGRIRQTADRQQVKIKSPANKLYADLRANNSKYNQNNSEEQILEDVQSHQNMEYLQQTNSVVYTEQDRDHQNFTFSHHNFTGEIQKSRRIVKLSTISDNKAIRTCQFSSSGAYFAVGTNSSMLKIFDVETLFQENKFRQLHPIYQIYGLHSKSIFCLDWAKDQASMVTCSNDLTIKLIQFSPQIDSHEFSVIGRHEACIRMVKFNHEQNKIFSCGDDSLVKVWDMGKVKRCYNLKGHSGGISAVKVCEKRNNQLYSVSKDSTIKRWDLRTLECTATSKHQESQMTFIANNTQKIVASNRNGNVLFFDHELNLDYEVKIHEEQIRSIEACPNQDLYITASFDGHVGMFSQKSAHSPDYFQHNENSQDKVVFATFLDHPVCKGFASTSTLGLCHIYSYF